MKKIIILFLIIVSFSIINTAFVSACSCAMPAPPKESLEVSTAVFIGKVVDIDTPSGLIQSSIDPVKVKFEVSEIFKGPDSDFIEIYTSISSSLCGYSFIEDKEYIVYANGEDELSTGICSRTKLLTDAEEDLEELRQHENPIPCTAYWEGYVFDEETKECKLEGASGCSSPFEYETKEACENALIIVPCPENCNCDKAGNPTACSMPICPENCNCDADGNVISCSKPICPEGCTCDFEGGGISCPINECSIDEDCVDSVEAFPQCNHYCIGDECEEVGQELCNVISKNSDSYKNRKNINCVLNKPCTKPSEVKCENNKCIVPSDKDCPENCNCDEEGNPTACSSPICPEGCTCDFEGGAIACPIEEEEPSPTSTESKTESSSSKKEIVCPEGCTCTKESIDCETNKVSKQEGCQMGCKLDDKCVIQGTRVVIDGSTSYCDINSIWQAQKSDDQECQNNYECTTNFCSNSKCYDVAQDIEETKSLLQNILSWLKGLFS